MHYKSWHGGAMSVQFFKSRAIIATPTWYDNARRLASIVDSHRRSVSLANTCVTEC